MKTICVVVLVLSSWGSNVLADANLSDPLQAAQDAADRADANTAQADANASQQALIPFRNLHEVATWEKPPANLRRRCDSIVEDLKHLKSGIATLKSYLGGEKQEDQKLPEMIGGLEIQKLQNDYNRNLMIKICSSKSADLSPERLTFFRVAIAESTDLSNNLAPYLARYGKGGAAYSPPKEDQALLKQFGVN